MNSSLINLLHSIGKESLDYCNQNRLDLIREIASKANLLTWDIPIISVTGTNGKGSSVTALKSIYQEAGFNAGVFTSPHIIDFNERIAINNTLISDEDFKVALQAIIDLDCERQLSFFEILTLTALYYFKQHPLDVLILEVGLGGRLDAINILDADVVLVTAIDLDHQDYLGDSIDAIAKEKAGLFRAQGLAVYSGEVCPKSLDECAKSLNVNLSCLYQDFHIEQLPTSWRYHSDTLDCPFETTPKILLSAFAGAIRVVELLQNRLNVSFEAIQKANTTAFIPGRFQWIDDKVMVVLDVAHNPHAVSLLANRLMKMPIEGKIYCVFSAFKDKDVTEIVKIFNNMGPLWYTCLLESERAHTKQSLECIFQELEVVHEFNESPVDAFKKARDAANCKDLIVVFGSFHLIREVMLVLKQEGKHVF